MFSIWQPFMTSLRVHIIFLLRKSAGKCKTHSWSIWTNLLFEQLHLFVLVGETGGTGDAGGNNDNDVAMLLLRSLSLSSNEPMLSLWPPISLVTESLCGDFGFPPGMSIIWRSSNTTDNTPESRDCMERRKSLYEGREIGRHGDDDKVCESDAFRCRRPRRFRNTGAFRCDMTSLSDDVLVCDDVTVDVRCLVYIGVDVWFRWIRLHFVQVVLMESLLESSFARCWISVRSWWGERKSRDPNKKE